MQIMADILCLLLAIVIAVIAGRLISQPKLPAILGCADPRNDHGAPRAGTFGGLAAERSLVQHGGEPAGVHRRPDDRHGAGPVPDEKGRQADPGHHHHRVPGDLPGGQPGVCHHLRVHRPYPFTWLSCSAASPWPPPRRRPCPWSTSSRPSGPVTSTLIPMAALDDLVGRAGLFPGGSLCAPAHLSTAGIPIPVASAPGIPAGADRSRSPASSPGNCCQPHQEPATARLTVMLAMLLVSAGIGFLINNMLPTPVLNFMLLGMAFSTVFSNMVTAEQLGGMMKVMNPAIGFSLVVAILNLARAAGLPPDLRRRHLHRGLHHRPGHRKIQRRVFLEHAGHPCPRNSEKVPGLHTCCPTPECPWCSPASRCRCCRARAPECASDHPGHHRGGSRHQRGDRGLHGQEGLCVGRRTAQGGKEDIPE